jgi:E3 ubiquitin-protein ligase HUWE1
MLQCEDTVPEAIHLFAVLALAAQSQDRPRQSNVLTVINAGGHRGILSSFMQKAIGSITESTLVEALLSLFIVPVSFSTGCAALREAGLIPSLIPLLKDMDPEHSCLARQQSSSPHLTHPISP